jgi:hypothetical protein
MVLVVLRLFLKARYPWRADTGTIVVLDRAPGAIGLDTDGMAVGKGDIHCAFDMAAEHPRLRTSRALPT